MWRRMIHLHAGQQLPFGNLRFFVAFVTGSLKWADRLPLEDMLQTTPAFMGKKTGI